MAYKYCNAETDPRMRTFDRLLWTAYLPGEFILYRDKRRKISVSTKHSRFYFFFNNLMLSMPLFPHF